MSNPSFSNIDLWLFELAEGNLSPEQVKQLEMFLLNHPELDVERDVWEMAKVDKQPVAYPNIADLERKRRPAAVYAFAGLFLLLLGTGSYIAWNSQSDEFTEADVIAQNEHVKDELLRQIKLSKSAKTVGNANQGSDEDQTNAVSTYENAGSLNQNSAQESGRVAINSGNVALNTGNAEPIFAVTSNQPSTGFSLVGDEVRTQRSIALLNSISAESQLLTPSVTNLAFRGYESELEDGLVNSDEVVDKEFFVRESSDIEDQEGRIWNERSAASNLPLASSNSSRTTFKDRLSKFTRSLERMMNAPIALKNSRDPHYHVPGLTSNDINFSSAGTLIATRVQATSRLQWQGKENEQLMNQLSVDGYSYDIRGGWGIQLNHQLYKDGGLQVAQAAFTYSPKISVSNWVSIEPSVRFKMGNKRLNAGQMQNTDMVELDRGNARDFYVNGTAPIGKNLWYKDLGIGLLVNTKWFFAGVQTDNLFKHKDNLYDNNWSDPRRAQNYFTATIGSDWVSRNEKLRLSPYAVYQKNERLSEVWAGANFAYKWFNIGIAASSNLEPAASVGMKFDHFSLHYNADYTESKMLGEKALSHQLTIRFVAKQSRFKKQVFKR